MKNGETALQAAETANAKALSWECVTWTKYSGKEAHVAGAEGEGGYRQGKLSFHCSKSAVPTCQKPFQSPYLSALSSPCSSQQPSAKLGRKEHKEHPGGHRALGSRETATPGNALSQPRHISLRLKC